MAGSPQSLVMLHIAGVRPPDRVAERIEGAHPPSVLDGDAEGEATQVRIQDDRSIGPGIEAGAQGWPGRGQDRDEGDEHGETQALGSHGRPPKHRPGHWVWGPALSS